MSKNINQITTAATSVLATDKLYLGRSPFGVTDDRYILGASLLAQVAPLTTKGDLYGFSTLNVRLPVAVGDGKILQVSSGAATGLAYSTPTYPSLSGTAGFILRSDGTNNVYSQTTYPDLVAANAILFGNSANTVGPITPAASSILVSSAGSVPSWSTTAPAFTMGGALTLSTSNPSAALEAASKGYVDAVAQGITIQGACVAASTTALTVVYNNVSVSPSGVGATLTNAGAFAIFTIDGVSPSIGQRVLIKNQASALQNGIYTVTVVGDAVSVNWVLTRATDFDVPAEIVPGDLVLLTGGSTQANSSWIQTATVTSVGVDSISFSQFSAALPVSVPNGGTGRSTSTTAYGLIAAGTTATGALQTLATGSAGQMLQSGGASALPAYSTSTYPATNAINTLLYASSANVMAALATVNSGVLVTSAGGVPSISTTLPAALTIPQPNIVGTTTNNNAAVGSVGELISSIISSASSVSIANNTATNVTTISLTAGDWDVTFVPTATLTYISGWISLVSATPLDASLTTQLGAPFTATGSLGVTVPYSRISISTTTTVYLTGFTTITAGTATVCGGIYARRAR